MIMRRVSYAIFGLVFIFGAEAGDKPEQKGKKRKPPQEAIEACVGKVKGDEVSFLGRHDEVIAARCELIGEYMAAVPKKHKRKKGSEQ